jgi:hypothetical protein
VVDTWSGERRTFHNPAGQAFAPLQRTDLFATCGTPQPCGQGNAADLAASPRADENAEKLALTLDGGIAASTATYDRVRADLAAIVAGAPGLADHRLLEKYSTQTLIVALDPDTSHFPAGPDWACLISVVRRPTRSSRCPAPTSCSTSGPVSISERWPRTTARSPASPTSNRPR